jgi:hypothetical protein
VHTYIIPALRKLKQEGNEYKGNLGYIVRPYFNKQTNKHPLSTLSTPWERK